MHKRPWLNFLFSTLTRYVLREMEKTALRRNRSRDGRPSGGILHISLYLVFYK